MPLPLLALIPSILGGWQRWLIYAVVAAALLAVAWTHGYGRGSSRLYEYQAEQARAAVAIVVKQGAATEKIVTEYVRVAGRTRTATEYIDREVVRYESSNPGLCLDPGWRLLHDAAATGAVAQAPGHPDGGGGTPRPTPARLRATDSLRGVAHGDG